MRKRYGKNMSFVIEWETEDGRQETGDRGQKRLDACRKVISSLG